MNQEDYSRAAKEIDNSVDNISKEVVNIKNHLMSIAKTGDQSAAQWSESMLSMGTADFLNTIGVYIKSKGSIGLLSKLMVLLLDGED